MDFTNFFKSLAYMGEGMLVVFIVMLLIAGSIALINKVFSK